MFERTLLALLLLRRSALSDGSMWTEANEGGLLIDENDDDDDDEVVISLMALPINLPVAHVKLLAMAPHNEAAPAVPKRKFWWETTALAYST